MAESLVSKLNASVEPCKLCGNKEWWWNNVPIEGTCGGPEDDRHDEVTVHPPLEAQIYAHHLTEAEKKIYVERFAGRQFMTRMVTEELE